MNFLSNLTKNDESKPDSDNKPHHKPASSSDLLNSAKVLADAAQSHFRHEPDKYDKAKVAGAAADILGAAFEYGHLGEEKGVGKYVDQAEEYLRKYGQSHPPSTAGNAAKPHNSEEGYEDLMEMVGDGDEDDEE